MSPTPMIGGDKYSPSSGLTITWFEDRAGQNYYVEHHLMYSPSQAGSSYADALGVADYLIVTSPANLFRLSPTSDTNELLSSMADLARLKNGVLGYLDVPASFPRNFEAHDGSTIGDVSEDAKAEVTVGDDTIEGGSGDKLQGMNGKDLIYGQSGDDVLDGGPGNDELDGGDGYDTLDGRSGRDFCDGEVERNCELGPA